MNDRMRAWCLERARLQPCRTKRSKDMVGLQALRDGVEPAKEHPSVAKAGSFRAEFSARLKSCPFKTVVYAGSFCSCGRPGRNAAPGSRIAPLLQLDFPPRPLLVSVHARSPLLLSLPPPLSGASRAQVIWGWISVRKSYGSQNARETAIAAAAFSSPLRKKHDAGSSRKGDQSPKGGASQA